MGRKGSKTATVKELQTAKALLKLQKKLEAERESQDAK